MSERTIFTILNTLEAKGYIEKNKETGSIRSTDIFNEIIGNKDDWIIGFKGKDSSFISGKGLPSKEKEDQSAEFAEGMKKLHTPYEETAYPPMKKLHSTYEESSYYNNRITISDNKKENSTPQDKLVGAAASFVLESFNSLTGTELRMTDKKKLQIRNRLRKFSQEELIQAIKNRMTSDFHTGKIDGKLWYRDWDSLFRNDEKVEAALQMNGADILKGDIFYMAEIKKLGFSAFEEKYGKEIHDKYVLQYINSQGG